MSEAPDLASPVAGWRLWHLGQDHDGPLLVSPLRPLAWSPRRAVTATCPTGCREPPTWHCTCGLYAAADLDAVAGYVGAPAVVGCTALWGRVVEGTAGWRAARAYPLVLFVPVGDTRPGVLDAMASASRRAVFRGRTGPLLGPLGDDVRQALGERYGVPVHALPIEHLGFLHPGVGAVRRARRRLRTDATVAGGRTRAVGAADALRQEAAGGLAARRLGDRDAERRLDTAVERLLSALRPDPPPIAV
ncbi:hypothetical protein Acsp06_51970 [Actinomycetospora sp. NBRC 106375]|uniref:hypothetical protein n=1 Tax=Actinomycetospora sp. NBRC 106375 TaxID=3032207 RepID=UPI0024A0D33D|nr:hypothetical protein [Actinomycetospora sp. NBRC 106375]GLZ49012.1 hypothetical protein Acsp06_51970 [Actinomycetospora sp. NBRC 106375]